MNIKAKEENFPVGTSRNIILQYLKNTENEWRCIEIQPNKRNKYKRKTIFIRDEAWKYEE